MRFVAIGAIATAIALSAVISGGGGGGGGALTLANLWVDTNGGTCIRHSPAAAYIDAEACTSFQAAYDASASGGDTIGVQPGTYNATQRILKNSHSQAGPMTTFQCTTAHACIVGGGIYLGQNNGSLSGDAESFLTFDGIDIIHDQFFTFYNQNADPQPTDLTFKNGHVSDIQSQGSGFVIDSVNNLTIQNFEVGPICCGGNGNGDDGMEIAVNRSGAPSNSNVLIDHVYIHDLYDTCTKVPSAITTQYGTCSGTGFGDGCGACDHVDGMQVYGAHGFTMQNSRIYAVNPAGAVGQGLFMQEANGGSFTNVLVVNNFFASTPNNDVSMSGPGSGTWSGYLHVYYNTIQGNLRIYGDSPSNQIFLAGTPVIVAGNINGNLASSNGNSCTIIDSSGATITPTYRNNLNGNQSCDATDHVGSPTYVSSSGAAPDLHLSGAQTAINGGEATFCPATDFDDQARPINSICDIGADEAG